MTRTALCALGLTLAASCGTSKPTDTAASLDGSTGAQSDADADADADADTDADSDTDSDTDTDTDTDTDADTADTAAAETGDTGTPTTDTSPADTAAPVAAGPIYAAEGRGLGRRLYRLNPLTGATSQTDLTRPYTDLSLDEAGGLYGIVGSDHEDRGQVFRIDPDTGTESPLFTVPLEDEFALTILPDSTFLAAEHDGAWAVLDGSGTRLAEGASSVRSNVYGAALTMGSAGTAWYAAGDAVYTWTEDEGLTLRAELRTPLVWQNGGGAAWHAGELMLSEVDDKKGTTALWAVDLLTGTASPSGLMLPSDRIDAIVSATP